MGVTERLPQGGTGDVGRKGKKKRKKIEERRDTKTQSPNAFRAAEIE